MNLVSAFNQQCSISPKQPAFSDEYRPLNYSQFELAVKGLAAFLRQHHSCKRPIALFLERGIDAAIAIYAVLSAGAAYLPLDIKNPVSRLNLILEDARPELIMGNGGRPANLATEFEWLDLQNIETDENEFETVEVEPDTIAAILYTSGSTGNPKGVALSHDAMSNFAQWAAKTFNLDENDHIASLAPFHFDLSIFDLFSTLATGASVSFIPAKLTLSPSRLTAWLAENRITGLYTVPSLLSFIAMKGNLANTPLPELRQVLFAGEVFPTVSLTKLAESLPDVELFNLYGPTETNVCCFWQVDRKRLQDDEPSPIGSPACGAKLTIAENGELQVDCKNNFSGYWQNGKLVPRDINRPYATGDKVSMNAQGEYCYHGRLDRMLKCSGYRVEPAEIEAVINHTEGVENCAVVGINDPSSGQRPAAVLILEDVAELSAVVRQIKQQLPAYMQPVKFKTLEALPVLSNGKTDYLAISRFFDAHET